MDSQSSIAWLIFWISLTFYSSYSFWELGYEAGYKKAKKKFKIIDNETKP